MLLPKTQRNSMLPAMWRIPPCMNIEVNRVTHQGAVSTGMNRSVWGPRVSRLGLGVLGRSRADDAGLELPRGSGSDRPDRAVAGLVGVRDPVGDRSVLERALVDPGEVQRRLAQLLLGRKAELPDEEGDVDRDQDHRDHREAGGRDVVLERDHAASERRSLAAASRREPGMAGCDHQTDDPDAENRRSLARHRRDRLARAALQPGRHRARRPRRRGLRLAARLGR